MCHSCWRRSQCNSAQAPGIAFAVGHGATAVSDGELAINIDYWVVIGLILGAVVGFLVAGFLVCLSAQYVLAMFR